MFTFIKTYVKLQHRFPVQSYEKTIHDKIVFMHIFLIMLAILNYNSKKTLFYVGRMDVFN